MNEIRNGIPEDVRHEIPDGISNDFPPETPDTPVKDAGIPAADNTPDAVAAEASGSAHAGQAAQDFDGKNEAHHSDSDQSEAAETGEADRAPEVSEASGQPQPDADRLRGELVRLQEELAQLRKEFSDRKADLARMDMECAEFRELYPGVSATDLPDAVLEQVRRGIPLAAAYALAERRNLLAQRQAEVSNRENLQRSSGALERRESGYFSPDEVRAMNREEVRRNYKNILRSMQKWT